MQIHIYYLNIKKLILFLFVIRQIRFMQLKHLYHPKDRCVTKVYSYEA